MKNAHVVIGANFGDEGKGLVANSLCLAEIEAGAKKVLNIRYNGGAQAGHTVVQDGRRHVFKTIGAGSFNPEVDTYLGEHFIFNPLVFLDEVQSFVEEFGIIPTVFMNANVRVTAPVDMVINRQLERSRGADRHGSCGLGILETVLHNQEDNYCLFVENWLEKRLHQLGIYSDVLFDRVMREVDDMDLAYLHALGQCQQFITTIPANKEKEFLETYDALVFEGAQGLLLSEARMEYFPHLTPSTTGIRWATDAMVGVDDFNIHAHYVTRTYLTRHGAGFMPNEMTRLEVEEWAQIKVVDKTNVPNEFQETLRYGALDETLLQKTIRTDLEERNNRVSIESKNIHITQTNTFFNRGLLVERNGTIGTCIGVVEELFGLREFRRIKYAVEETVN